MKEAERKVRPHQVLAAAGLALSTAALLFLLFPKVPALPPYPSDQHRYFAMAGMAPEALANPRPAQAQGLAREAPFCWRPAGPWLAGLVARSSGIEVPTAFSLLSHLGLALSGLALWALLLALGATPRQALLAPLVLYTSPATLCVARVPWYVDGPVLALSCWLWLAVIRRRPWLAALLALVAAAFKEVVLLAAPAVFVLELGRGGWSRAARVTGTVFGPASLLVLLLRVLIVPLQDYRPSPLTITRRRLEAPLETLAAVTVLAWGVWFLLALLPRALGFWRARPWAGVLVLTTLVQLGFASDTVRLLGFAAPGVVGAVACALGSLRPCACGLPRGRSGSS